MDIVEEVARKICMSRGGDPDTAITVGQPDGTTAQFDPAWLAYADTAQEIVGLVQAEPAPE